MYVRYPPPPPPPSIITQYIIICRCFRQPRVADDAVVTASMKRDGFKHKSD